MSDHGIYKPGQPRYAYFVRVGFVVEARCLVCGCTFAYRAKRKRPRRTCSDECSKQLFDRKTGRRVGGRTWP